MRVPTVSFFGGVGVYHWCIAPPKVSRPLNLNKEFLHNSSGQISAHSIHGTGIFTYIWLIFMVSAGNCTIHGCYGVILKADFFLSIFGVYIYSIYIIWADC